jgi:hypothetical protein
MGDQDEAFGQVASVPAVWRTPREAAAGADRTHRKVSAAVNRARRYAWSQVIARHGQLPPVQVADRPLTGITCIRLDATVVPAHSDKELAEAKFKGYGHHPLLAACDKHARAAGLDDAARIGWQQHGRRSPGQRTHFRL